MSSRESPESVPARCRTTSRSTSDCRLSRSSASTGVRQRSATSRMKCALLMPWRVERHSVLPLTRTPWTSCTLATFATGKSLIARWTCFLPTRHGSRAKRIFSCLIDLAILAEKKLLEGGSLVCYLGQILVDHAAAAFRQHLKYHWIFSAPRGNGKLFNRSDSYRILSQWRCVLWYVKGSYIAPRQKALGDVLPPSAPEKLYHEWQQPLPEAIYLIDGICPPDGLVGDPMICSGTTAVAAEKTGRRWVGCEIDPQIANIASKRIKEERRKSSAFGGAVGPSAPDRGKEPRNGQSRG